MKSKRLIRTLSMLAALALAFPLAGCGDDEPEQPSNNTNNTADMGISDAGNMTTDDAGTEDSGTEDAAADDAGTDDAGTDDAGTEDTGPEFCDENERVEAGACVACDTDTFREAGDDPTGPDTRCYIDDECYAALGVDCDAFNEAYIKADDPSALDFFGISADLSADGQILVVGAQGYEPDGAASSDEDQGAAYVFVRDGDTWSQQAILSADNAAGDYIFGRSVAVSGETVVVGSPAESSDGTDPTSNSLSRSGAVYVFDRDAQNQWSQTTMLKASNPGEDDEFGDRVDIEGDTIVVGARQEDSLSTGVGGDQTNDGGTDSGAAYVFERDAQGDWAQRTYLKASHLSAGDWFGMDVSISGDTIAVGARYEDSESTGVGGNASNDNLEDSGAVFVFVRDGQTWAQEAYIKASNTDQNDSFGYRVELAGDTLAVSAPGESSTDSGVDADQSNNDRRSGAVYIFERAGTNWSQEVYIKAPNNDPNHNSVFGQSISLSASGDKLAVGSPLERSSSSGLNGNQTDFDPGTLNSGSAYIYSREAGAWTHDVYLKAPNSHPRMRYGQEAVLSADGDRLVVGAQFEDGGSSGIDGDMTQLGVDRSGAVYMYRIAP